MGKRYFGCAEEATYGTFVSPSKYNDLISETITPNQGWVLPETAGSRGYTKRVLGPFSDRGEARYFLEPENFDHFYKWTLGSVATTKDQDPGTVAYKHEFTFADTVKSFSGEIGIDIITRKLMGCLINRLTIRGRAGEPLEGAAELLVKNEIKGTLGTPSFSTLPSFMFQSGDLDIKTTQKKGIASELEVVIDNNMPYDRRVLEDRTFPRIKVGKRKITGKLSLWFEDSNDYDSFLAGEEWKLTFKTLGPSTGSAIGGFEYYLFKIELEKCAYTGMAPHVDRQELAIIDAPFEALENAANKLTLINKVSGY